MTDSIPMSDSVWKSAIDSKSGREYFYNVITKETRWTLPPQEPTNAPTPLIKVNRAVSSSDLFFSRDSPNRSPRNAILVSNASVRNILTHSPKSVKADRENEPLNASNAKTGPVRIARSESEVRLVRNPVILTSANLSVAQGGKLNAISEAREKPKGRKLLDDGDDDIPVPKFDAIGGLQDVSKVEELDLGDPSLWRKAIDRRNGRAYYYNLETKETSYVRPKGYLDDNDNTTRRSRGSSASADGRNANQPMSPNERRMLLIKMQSDSLKDVSEKSNSLRKSSVGSIKESYKKGSDSESEDDKEINESDQNSEQDADSEIEIEESNAQTLQSKEYGDLVDGNEYQEKKTADEDCLKRNSSSGHGLSIGPDGIEYRFAFHRKGFLNRVFHLGKINDEMTMLSYKKSMLKKALLKENRSNDLMAIQCFKNIMSYMGDRSSFKSDVGHAKTLIRNILNSGQSIRDEVFLQICKQVTNHPNTKHSAKGWELMMLVLGSVSPSASVREYIERLGHSFLDQTSMDVEVKNWVKICLNRIPKIQEIGSRLEAPSGNEIKREQAQKTFLLKIYTLEGSVRTFDVDCFTLVREVKREIIQRLSLSVENIFSLYEVNRHGDERVLEDKVRILDIIGKWDRLIKEHGIRHPEPFRIIFKARLVLKTSESRLIEDEEILKLLFNQSYYDIVHERYPVAHDAIPSMLALYLCANYGEFKRNEQSMEWLEEQCKRGYPSSALEQLHRKKSHAYKIAAQKLMSKYSKLIGVTPNEARVAFLDYAQDSPVYGASLIIVEQEGAKEFPPIVMVGVNCEGVHIVHSKTKDVLESFNWNDLITWGASEHKLIVQVGDIMRQKKITFKTPLGKYLMQLIQGYIEEGMSKKKSQ